ncbi:MAG: bifunctional metallophosphatase/5'-nucleotidase [Lachnospiraceae bacterium]|nr:bifunctional metallophosphatase/5'-nucleotidase [Lachnospiraceae bacterium]
MENRIRLLCTSDIHGAVYPYSYADMQEKNQGIAKLKTLIDSLRDENTIVIENGDTIEGSPLTFYHYMNDHDGVCPVTQALAMIGYDYVNVGNHDFNEGREALFTHLKTLGAPCITHNFLYRGKPVGAPYDIREIAGKRIALFGLTTQYIPHWESEAHLKDIAFTDAYETAKETVAALKALPEGKRPDYIVCIYHGGFECDPVSGVPTEKDTGENEGYRIMTQIPGIDVFLTGHQHREYCAVHEGCAYTQPAANGRFLAMVDIDTETGAITPSLLPVDTKADESVTAATAAAEAACQKWLDQTLGTCKIDLKIRNEDDARLHKTQLITFFNRVQMEMTGAQISACALFLGATGFGEVITMRDIVSTYLFPNTLTVKRVTGKTLRAYLEKTAAFWAVGQDGTIGIDPRYDFPTPGHFNYDMADGVSYTIRVSNPEGKRIEDLKRNGKEVRDEDVFTLVVNNYRAAGGGDYEMIAESETVKEYLTSMVEILAQYIMKHPVIDFTPVHNIQVVI